MGKSPRPKPTSPWKPGHILGPNSLVAPAPEAVPNPRIDIANHDLVAEACESAAGGLTHDPSTYHTDAADAARRPTLQKTPPSAHTPDIDRSTRKVPWQPPMVKI